MTGLRDRFMRRGAPLLRGAHEPHWRREESPEGIPWAPRSYGSWPILKLTGVMQSTVEFHSSADKFLATTIDYGKKHQYGDGVRERVWLGIPDSILPELENILLEEIENELQT